MASTQTAILWVDSVESGDDPTPQEAWIRGAHAYQLFSTSDALNVGQYTELLKLRTWYSDLEAQYGINSKQVLNGLAIQLKFDDHFSDPENHKLAHLYIVLADGRTSEDKASEYTSYFPNPEAIVPIGFSDDMWGLGDVTIDDIEGAYFYVSFYRDRLGGDPKQVMLEDFRVILYYNDYEILLRETTSVTDSNPKQPQMTKTEEIDLADSVVRTISKLATETVDIAEVFAQRVSKTFTQVLSVSDAILRHISITLTQTVSIADTIMRWINGIRWITIFAGETGWNRQDKIDYRNSSPETDDSDFMGHGTDY
jgi:hypothetical protein